MARTKQIARKSTGGMAPRIQIETKTRCRISVKSKKKKTKFYFKIICE
jgi:hypothetical protein